MTMLPALDHDLLDDWAPPTRVAEAVAAVLAERQRQDAKWGQQNHAPASWFPILGEEYGEVCKALTENEFRGLPLAQVVTELTETLAVAVAWAECLDRATLAPGTQAAILKSLAWGATADLQRLERPFDGLVGLTIDIGRVGKDIHKWFPGDYRLKSKLLRLATAGLAWLCELRRLQADEEIPQ